MAKPEIHNEMFVDFLADKTVLNLNINIKSKNIHQKHAPSEIAIVEQELDAVIDYFKSKLRDNMRR